MTKQVQRRRGTATQHTSFTGAEGEISVNTTNKSVHVHDGVTAGGVEAARADLSNVSEADVSAALAGATNVDINGGNIDGTVIGANSAAAITGTTITGTSFVSSGNMTFGDNDKAIFGAGSDLQIYHDGSNSYVRDNGNGNLRITSDSQVFIAKHNSENMLRATADGSVDLYFDSEEKLSTTSTGIDVTGTVTADGLTVDGGTTLNDLIEIGGSTASLVTGSANPHIFRTTAGGDYTFGELVLQGRSDTAGRGIYLATGATPANRLKVSDNGDISFYEDTGTTAKLHWSASAERLGIGTSSPSQKLDIVGGSIKLDDSQELRFGTSSVASVTGVDGASGYLSFATNGVANRMRIDSSGNVGIGQAPSNFSGWTTLEVKGGSNGAMINFEDSSSARVAAVASASDRLRIQTFVAEPITLETNNSERMRITSSGSVGIGTSTVSTKYSPRLHVSSPNSDGKGGILVTNYRPSIIFEDISGGTPAGIQIEADAGSLKFSADTNQDGTFNSERLRITSSGDILAKTIDARIGSDVGAVEYGTSTANSVRFYTNNTEAARFDGSGNFLVGTTTTDRTSADGITAGNNGFVDVSRTSDISGRFTRRSTDGEMVRFRNPNGQTAGSIGSAAGARLYIGSGDTNLRMAGDLDTIVPWNGTNNSLRDAAIDLGESTGRFKDLYLSGGVYLGGTGSANKLDDYEEGTWTLTSTAFTITNQHAYYRVIGDVCYAWFYITGISNINSNAVQISIPLTSSSSQGFGSAGSVFVNYNNISPTSVWINGSSTVANFYNSTSTNANFTQFAGSNIYSGSASSFAMYAQFQYRIA